MSFYKLTIILIIFLITSCIRKSKENDLTSRQLLLYSAFKYHNSDDSLGGFNIQVLKGDSEISSIGFHYSDLQKQLVFEMLEDGTVSYWFKKDYIISPVDTITLSNGQKALSHTMTHSDQIQNKVRNIYTLGKWQANFRDSSIKIDFGKNNFSLLPIVGKYTSLGVGGLSIAQTSFFDSLVNNKSQTFKKVINIYFDPY